MLNDHIFGSHGYAWLVAVTYACFVMEFESTQVTVLLNIYISNILTPPNVIKSISFENCFIKIVQSLYTNGIQKLDAVKCRLTRGHVPLK